MAEPRTLSLRQMGKAALRPDLVFPALAAQPQGPGLAGLRMLAWRVPLGVLGGIATLRGLALGLEEIKRLEGPWAQALLSATPGVAPEDLQSALADLPQIPGGTEAFLGLLLLVPLGLVGIWFHHALWDHCCLWLLKGLRKEKAWHATWEAEASALQVGVLGAALGLMTLLPGIGAHAWPLVMLVDLWFWGLRGVALAAFHGCPAWKGVIATLLHGLLLMGIGCGLLGVLALMAGMAA